MTAVIVPPTEGSDKNFVHSQLSASTHWVVDHGMGKRPSVTIVDSAGTVVIGEVTYTSDNQVVIDFSAPFAGKAYLN